jgi:hypothetical protein
MGSRYCVKIARLMLLIVNISEVDPGLTCSIMAVGSQPLRLIN